MIKVIPLNKFRRLKEFAQHFRIENDTVITYDGIIYSNNELHPDILVHEKVHIEQQKKHGLANFTNRYLNDKKFRLEVEKEAFIAQIDSIKDEGLKEAVIKDSIKGLTSGLYAQVLYL